MRCRENEYFTIMFDAEKKGITKDTYRKWQLINPNRAYCACTFLRWPFLPEKYGSGVIKFLDIFYFIIKFCDFHSNSV